MTQTREWRAPRCKQQQLLHTHLEISANMQTVDGASLEQNNLTVILHWRASDAGAPRFTIWIGTFSIYAVGVLAVTAYMCHHLVGERVDCTVLG